MASSTFSITRRVEFHETDAAGIMHFSNFYKWMEICEHEWFRTEGITMMSTSSEGIRRGWPRREASCNFIRSVQLGDLVRVNATISKLSENSLCYEYIFEKDRAGKWTQIASGRMTTVHVKQNSGGIMEAEPYPDNIRIAFNFSS
jgi:YbgC/YbaW family acyl-CoA thioester hydrolase